MFMQTHPHVEEKTLVWMKCILLGLKCSLKKELKQKDLK